MEPNILTLEGFKGIRAGRGKDAITVDLDALVPQDARIVAITGPNGSGKTTILDNLHPYRTMPSHSSTLTVGGFSYWDHIHGNAAKKELEWTNGGRRYRQTLVFRRTNTTQKTSAYLHVLSEASGEWEPVELKDGTKSDGSTASYDRCIESILGPSESFFTSHFAAQGRKPLSGYTASEIKALLASILNYADLQEKSAKARLVANILKLKLDELQGTIGQSRGAQADADEVKAQIAALDEALAGRAEVEQQHQAAIDGARKALALIEARRDAQAADEQQRHDLNEQLRQIAADAEHSRSQIQAQHQKDVQAVGEARTRAQEELEREKAKQPLLEAEIKRLTELVGRAAEIEAAIAAAPNLRAVVDEQDRLIEASQSRLETLRPVREAVSKDTAGASSLTTAGMAKAEQLASLKETAGLIGRVPCRGSTMQGACPLLANANAAEAKIVPQARELQDKRDELRTVHARIKANTALLEEAQALEQSVRGAHAERKKAADMLDRNGQLCAMAPLLDDARARLPQLKQAGEAFQSLAAKHGEQARQFDAHVVELEQTRQRALDQVDAQRAQRAALVAERIAKLAAPITDAQIAAARRDVDTAIAALNAAQIATQASRDKRNEACARLSGLQALIAGMQETVAKAERIGNEIAKWRLVEHGCGNNGLIALSIDDAGPAIAAHCNALLRACYGPRFTVSFDTQEETKKGNLKETFDIRVWDGEVGEEKSLTNMSPGERVWINDCLARSIALYESESSGRSIQTLFTDETDGPLDPERKRQFMRMKRALLEHGNCREFFISHTPDLQEMADYCLDVTTL
ncbi:AAA family ATPase [Noviherbaspirillum pedocola]|uniref:AAA family ATPase n=1 Tax=Noviherbaspirillum pedocola TaxID=2801341 RepID=A0A934SUT9_9BURK|nr:AAA family ATPase [Noviherbaspirillum pedocola]MBK4735979.1 AAA family ATPase [Noviherbaspirillum pedocola]